MAGTTRTLVFDHDSVGNRTRITHPDDGSITYDYDGLDRMSSAKGSGTTSLADFTYDSQGRRSSLDFGAASTTYGYDGASRLASLVQHFPDGTWDHNATFLYNPAAQIVTRTGSNDLYAWTAPYDVNRSYAVNGLNQYWTVTNAGQAAKPMATTPTAI